MKKKVFTIVAVLVLSLVLAASAHALSPIKIVFDGNELESEVVPAIANGRVMVSCVNDLPRAGWGGIY